ncbi:MAG: contractile injection system protein, VgrG/Pvc8 family [Verrucomicrobiota bacterium]
MPDIGDSNPFQSARPEVILSGKVDSDLAAQLESLLVVETTDGLFRCEATFGNWGAVKGGTGFRHFQRDKLDFGKQLEIKVGDGDAHGKIFDGRITAIEAQFPAPSVQALITVLAEDQMQDLRMTRRTRNFENTTDKAVFQKIATEHGLTAELDANGPTYQTLAQINQSDLAFIRDRARSIDAEAWVDGKTLKVVSRGKRRNDKKLTLTWREGLREFTVCADLAGQRTSIVAGGWDVNAKDGVSHTADAKALGNELGSDLSGPSILDQTFGKRADAIVHTAPFNSDEAKARAEAGLRRMARKFVTGRGVAEGDARLRAGAIVNLEKIGSMFSGGFYLNEVRHFFDKKTGYRVSFCVERPGIGKK